MKLCIARIAKNIAYFLVPIFLVLLITSIAGLIIMDANIGIKNTSSYYETTLFSDQYFSDIYQNYYVVQPSYLDMDNTQVDYESYSNYGGGIQEETEVAGKNGFIYYSVYQSSNFRYLVIDKESAVAKTNLDHTMRTDSVEEIVQVLQENDIYWNYVGGEVQTNIPNLSMENIRYTPRFENMMVDSDRLEIYTVLLNDTPYHDDYAMAKMGYDFSMKANDSAPILIPVSIIALIVLTLVIIHGIGRTAKQEGIYLNWFDKWKLEIVLCIGGIIFFIGIACLVAVNSNSRPVIFSGVTLGASIIYLSMILMLETFVKRIKTHTLWKSTILYAIGHEIKLLFEHRKIATKLVWGYWGFCLLGFLATMFIMRTYNGEAFFWYCVLAMLGIATFLYLFKKIREFDKIQTAIKSIYEGNTDIHLNPNEMKGVLKNLAIYVEDIAGGLSNAVEQSLKSERLKTELITNVSHDIKTPLTSIINYVDLLKKEKMPNEKATEYLMILENKSQRLKRLTEDLVEASKASSGNIKLQMEKINVNELIKQVSGEFEDRFHERGIEEIMTLPEEPIFIMADGRYLYRVLENIYSNCAKYAMENSRVYLDVVTTAKSVVIQMKNTSQEKLNITADELMQRFVRGEASRNTEGSGLRTFYCF